MIVKFDESTFNDDLIDMLEGLDKFNSPLVVLPTDKDVKNATKMREEPKFSHITFISFDYWYSKKWIADGEYDAIDFFRFDQVLIKKSFGTKVVKATVSRVFPKKKEAKNDTDESLS